MPDVSDTWIKLNYWFLTNRKDLKRWWVMLLAGFDVFLIIFVVTNGVVTLTSFGSTTKMIEEIGAARIVTAESRERIAPQALIVPSVETAKLSDEKFAYLVSVKNPNATWSASSLSYSFQGSAATTDPKETFLLPGEERHLVFVGLLGEPVSLKTEVPTWLRTPANHLPEIRLTFAPGQHNLVSVREQGRNRLVSQITTQATNASLYNIRSAKGVVIIRNGSVLVAAQQFFIDDLSPRETRAVTIQFTEALASTASIVFQSEVNVLDESVIGL